MVQCGMAKIWKVKSEVPDDLRDGIISAFSTHPHPAFGHLPPGGKGTASAILLAQLLYNRGLTDKDRMEEFLEPKYENLHSPFLFQDMEKAVVRIWQAIEKKEKICIYGDYD